MMDVNIGSMVDYIVEQSEGEGHFKFYEFRGRIWQMLKEGEMLGTFVEELRTTSVELLGQFSKASDGYVLLQKKWLETVASYINGTAPGPTSSILHEICSAFSEVDSDSRLFHLSSILHTVAAHEFTYLHRSSTLAETAHQQKQHKEQVKEISDFIMF